jgi:hypothetical protein
VFGDLVALGEDDVHAGVVGLDAGYGVAGGEDVVADAELADAEGADVLLGLADAAEVFDSDGGAVRDARGEAGHRGLVPRGEAATTGQLADVGLRQFCVDEGAADGVLAGGFASGAEVASVVEVAAVEDGVVCAVVGYRAEEAVEFVFAVEAAVGAVIDIT